MIPKKNKPAFPVVQSYESMLEGEIVKLVMYRCRQLYGIVTLFPDVAVAADYRNNESNELRTLIGNETSIIDWVSLELAKDRYAHIVVKLLYQSRGVGSPNETVQRKLQLVR